MLQDIPIPTQTLREASSCVLETERLVLRRPTFLVGISILLFWVVCAVFGTMIAPHSAQGLPHSAFSKPHASQVRMAQAAADAIRNAEPSSGRSKRGGYGLCQARASTFS